MARKRILETASASRLRKWQKQMGYRIRTVWHRGCSGVLQTTKPSHPYSRELLNSTISLSTTRLHSIPGAPPNLVDPPAACRFHPRCPDAMKVCAELWPPTITTGTARRSECWLHAKEDIPAGLEAPLEREALAVAEEA